MEAKDSWDLNLKINENYVKDVGDQCAKEDDAVADQEALIEVTFQLPNGEDMETQFKRGQTVSVLKSFLATDCDLKMERQELYYKGTLMIDPFTLNDYPSIVNSSAIHIEVHCRK